MATIEVQDSKSLDIKMVQVKTNTVSPCALWQQSCWQHFVPGATPRMSRHATLATKVARARDYSLFMSKRKIGHIGACK